jgi:hypothetical protein
MAWLAWSVEERFGGSRLGAVGLAWQGKDWRGLIGLAWLSWPWEDRPGMSWCGRAWLASDGGLRPGVASLGWPARRAGHVELCSGEAWLARRGASRQGAAQLAVVRQGWQGEDRHGGLSGFGHGRQVEACPGKARSGLVGHGRLVRSRESGLGRASRGMAVMAGRVWARSGESGLLMAGMVKAWPAWVGTEGVSRQVSAGVAVLGVASYGWEWLGQSRPDGSGVASRVWFGRG